MPSVADLEAGGYATWSADEVTEIDGWTVRANGGFTRRANTATCTGPASTSRETGRVIEAWLTARGASFGVRVTPLAPTDVVAGVESSWGLRPMDETPVMTAPIGSPKVADGVEVVDPTGERFIDLIVALNGRPEGSADTRRRIIERALPAAAGVVVDDVGVGFVAICESTGFLYSLAVAESHRRRGLGRAITEAGMAWAKNRGADVMALQVVGTNEPALELYRSMEFTEQYRYFYLQ